MKTKIPLMVSLVLVVTLAAWLAFRSNPPPPNLTSELTSENRMATETLECRHPATLLSGYVTVTIS